MVALGVLLGVAVVYAANCPANKVADCSMVDDACEQSYVQQGQSGGVLCVRVANESSCEEGSESCEEVTPPPPTPKPSAPAPGDTPAPDDGSSDGGLSDGVKIIIFALSYFLALGGWYGGIKLYRHYYPPESKVGAALSLLRGGKK